MQIRPADAGKTPRSVETGVAKPVYVWYEAAIIGVAVATLTALVTGKLLGKGRVRGGYSGMDDQLVNLTGRIEQHN